MNQEDYDESLKHIEIALQQGDLPPHAYAIRGMIRLQNEDFAGATEDFRIAKESDATHLWACYGAAACDDAMLQHDAALAGYQQALRLATTDEHRAACLLGIGRAQGFLGNYQQATEAVVAAQQLQPACDIESVARPLIERFKELRAESADEQSLARLREFLQTLSQLFVATKIEFAEHPVGESFEAPLLNGDFELDAFRHWSDELGVVWRNDPGYQASAAISQAEVHGGSAALHLIGDPGPGTAPEGNAGLQGGTGQEFPVPANSTCRLSVWAKTFGLEPGAVRLIIDEVNGVELAKLELTEGSYGWRELSTQFEVAEPRDLTATVVPLRLRILSAGGGEAFLDDLRVTVTRR